MKNYAVYIANEQKYADLASFSARSIATNISIRMDSVLFGVGETIEYPAGFDLCVSLSEIPGCSWAKQKTLLMPQIVDHFRPEDRIMLIDCNTYVLDDVAPLFELLEIADMAGAHQDHYSTGVTSCKDIQRSFTEYSPGAVLMKVSTPVLKVWNRAAEIYNAMGDEFDFSDRLALRDALWLVLHEDPRFRCIAFPKDWNHRSGSGVAL